MQSVCVQCELQRYCGQTDPVVSAHGVEAVGAADKHQVVVSGNQHFDEVVALVLKNTQRHFENSQLVPARWRRIQPEGIQGDSFLIHTRCFPFTAHMSLSD